MEQLYNAYQTFFGECKDKFKVFAPYRICPLGAHVDHQHGLVSGFAFDSGIDFLLSDTDNGMVEMCSLSFDGLVTFDVRKTIEEKHNAWGDYLRGAVWALQQDYRLQYGVRGVVRGSMPIGGVSSSAALLCGFVMALDYANHLGLDKMQIIHYASMAERKYVGLNNGILDQACVMLCEKDKLLYLDTQDSQYRLLPFDGKGERMSSTFKIGIFFSGVTRKLTGTDYNLRVSECKTAAWMLQAYEDIPLKELQDTYLRNVDHKIFDRHAAAMPERFVRRARHFYTECERVRQGAEAWHEGDIKRFGQLMFESCGSSMNNYECGSPELIELYEIAMRCSGVYGGRFSGAGFKGAFISLCDPDAQDDIRQYVTTEYLKKFPQYKDSFQMFFCDTCNGVSLED